MRVPDLLPSSKTVVDVTSWLVVTPLRILLIVVLALVARWLAHRAIRRLIRTDADGAPPAVLRPLRERAGNIGQATGLLSERRTQRAGTIGSLLRNVASILIFTVTVLLILAELRIDLAPLLASAGIAGLAIGFGAQYVVRDVISGVFMIVEDQYGVGDTVDLGEAIGEVEAVGLRVTTVRDLRGVVWYVRNGEVLRVGNHSQGWARVVIDIPIGLGTPVEDAADVIRRSADQVSADPEVARKLLDSPEVWGVQDVTLDGPLVRLVVRTTPDEQWAIGRRLRGAVVEALNEAGVSSRIAGTRLYVRPAGTS